MSIVFDLAISVLVFTSATPTDYAVVRNQEAVAASARLRAGSWSVAVYLVWMFGTLVVVDASWWYALPECAGLLAGNWLALRGGPADVVVVDNVTNSCDAAGMAMKTRTITEDAGGSLNNRYFAEVEVGDEVKVRREGNATALAARSVVDALRC